MHSTSRSDALALSRFDVHGDEQLRQLAGTGQRRDPRGKPHGGLHRRTALALPAGICPCAPWSSVPGTSLACWPARSTGRKDSCPGRSVSPPRLFPAMLRSTADPCPAALRDGLAIYFCGDIPWRARTLCPAGCSACRISSSPSGPSWPSLTRVPVFHVFCTHLPGGKFPARVRGRRPDPRPARKDDAVADYLKQLEARIATYPAQAVAHLLWPCFDPSDSDSSPTPEPRIRPALAPAGAIRRP